MNKPAPLIVCVSFLLLCSCSLLKPDEPSPYHGLSDAQQIHSLVLDTMLGPDSVYRTNLVMNDRILIRNYRIHPDDKEWQQRFYDSLAHLPDSIALNVRIREITGGEKLHKLKPGERLTAFNSWTKDWHDTVTVRQDYLQLIYECDRLSASPLLFDLQLLRSRYRYALRITPPLADSARLIIGPGIQFSRIAFNSDSTKAVIFTGLYCGDMCGSGDYWLLEKKLGDWLLHSILGIWVV